MAQRFSMGTPGRRNDCIQNIQWLRRDTSPPTFCSASTGAVCPVHFSDMPLPIGQRVPVMHGSSAPDGPHRKLKPRPAGTLLLLTAASWQPKCHQHHHRNMLHFVPCRSVVKSDYSLLRPSGRAARARAKMQTLFIDGPSPLNLQSAAANKTDRQPQFPSARVNSREQACC
jgi:hypothetical protein